MYWQAYDLARLGWLEFLEGGVWNKAKQVRAEYERLENLQALYAKLA